MERFLANYKPPLCKKAKGSEKEVEKSRKYENEKHKRRFYLSSKASFGWLEYHVINKEGKMFCNTCRGYDHAGSFSVGNTNVKLETIKAHARLQSHRQYQLRLDAKRRPEDTVAHKMLMTKPINCLLPWFNYIKNTAVVPFEIKLLWSVSNKANSVSFHVVGAK